MSEGATQKFDVKACRRYLNEEAAPFERSPMLLMALDRIEALEKVAAAVACLLADQRSSTWEDLRLALKAAGYLEGT